MNYLFCKIAIANLIMFALATFEPKELREVINELSIQESTTKKGVKFSVFGRFKDKVKIEFQEISDTLSQPKGIFRVY